MVTVCSALSVASVKAKLPAGTLSWLLIWNQICAVVSSTGAFSPLMEVSAKSGMLVFNIMYQSLLPGRYTPCRIPVICKPCGTASNVPSAWVLSTKSSFKTYPPSSVPAGMVKVCSPLSAARVKAKLPLETLSWLLIWNHTCAVVSSTGAFNPLIEVSAKSGLSVSKMIYQSLLAGR